MFEAKQSKLTINFKLLWPVLGLFLTSCASSGFRPPKAEKMRSVHRDVRENKSQKYSLNEEISFLYLSAQQKIRSKQTVEACKDLKKLYSFKKFSLNKLIFTQLLKNCPEQVSKEEVKNLDLSQINWLNSNYQEGLYYYYKFHKNHEQLIEQALIFIPEMRNHGEQVKEYNFIKDLISSTHPKYDEVIEMGYKLFPRIILQPKPEDYYSVARSYEKVRNYDMAREFYRKIIRNKKDDFKNRLKAMERHALSYKLERDKEKYAYELNTFAKLVYKISKQNPNDKDIKKAYYDLKINYVRGLWTVEQTEKAQNILKRLKTFPSAHDEALAKINWLLGAMAIEAKEYRKAQKYFKIAASYNIEDEDLYYYVHWDQLWTSYLQKNYSQAIEVYLKAKEKIKNEYKIERMRFWAAKAYKESGDVDSANEHFAHLSTHRPYTYYGISSYKELNYPIPPLSFEEKLDTAKLPNALQWLIALNLKDEKKRYIRDYVKNKNLDLEERLAFYHLSGSHAHVFGAFFAQDEEKRLELFKKYPQYIFPIPIEQELALKPDIFSEVENELILSIIRQESSFDPMARSWADAFGLMQLLPKKSKELATRYKIEYEDFFDLYDPLTNVQLGMALLKELKKKFDNKFIHLVAAYNAGGSTVRKWDEKRFVDIPMMDIESIPYKETRGYVKLVLRNFLIYKRLRAKEPFYFPTIN